VRRSRWIFEAVDDDYLNAVVVQKLLPVVRIVRNAAVRIERALIQSAAIDKDALLGP
jgi:hypothetical protein